jgi:TP901 family phage tail tape measure protein
MIINASNLDLVFRGYKAVYSTAFEATPALYDKVAMTVPSSTGQEEYGWLGQFPQLREWIGERHIKNLKSHGFTIKNRDFESTVAVARNDLADDRVGIYTPMFKEMGRTAKIHPDTLVFGLLKAGFATNGFDGQYFFDTDHPLYDQEGDVVGSVANLQAGSGAPWYLMDLSRAIKPLIWQDRAPNEFVPLGLDGTQAGRRLNRSFLDMIGLSRRASQAIRETKGAADALGQSAGPAKLSRSLKRMAAEQQAHARTMRGIGPTAAAAITPSVKGTIGGYLTARAATDSIKRHAEAERAVTRIGVTADASKEAVAGVGETAFKVAQEVAMPYDQVVKGLEVLVAQGRSLQGAMEFLPSVARTASAAGAEVQDIALTADSVSANFKIAGQEMQRAFDIMATGGKAGQFELKDMARYLPSLGPAAAAAGFQGEEGLRNLVAMLQVMRKGSGTSEEATSSLMNIFQKMESEETTKRFKKFGVDLEAGMAKGRKEGRNLVEVFEELTSTALKGDLSKIPKLFQDQEFARGVRALMTYRGEWQKLSQTISSTAAGSVRTDLGKVTDNVQARLDRLANSYARRMRQLGAVLSDVLTPIDKKIDEITSGKNETFNAIDKAAQRYSADITAREEMRTGERREVDPETRPIVDARREFLERQAFDDAVAKLDRDIAAKEAELRGLAQRSQGAGKARQDAILGPGRKAVEALQAERDALIAIVKARDEANLSLAENEGERKRLNTRFLRPDDEPGPISPGLKSFGFGPQGQKAQREPLPVETEAPAPLPPPRPDSLPKAVPTLKSLKDIYGPPSARGDVGEVVKGRLKSLTDLIPGADADPYLRGRNQADRAPRNRVASNATAAGRFGFGPGGAPTTAEPRGTGPGAGSFRTSIKDWAKSLIGEGDIDLGGAGITIAESLAAGVKSGTGAVSAAAGGMNDAVRNAAGVDLTSAGQQAAESYAAGLRKGMPAVSSAAQALGAAAVSAANRNVAARGGKTLSGALHDGVE